MTEIKLQLEGESTPQWLANNLRARADELAEIAAGASARALRALADSIEEQVRPAVEEPGAFGSIVLAGTGGPDRMLWQAAPDQRGKHYWESETGAVEVWSELTDVEVLRVGVADQGVTREDLAYAKGAEDFAAKVRREIHALNASVVTAPEKRTCQDLLALVAALLGES